MVVVDISEDSNQKLQLNQVCFDMVPFTEAERKLLMDLFCGGQLNTTGALQGICEANFTLGSAFARAVKDVLKRHAIPLESVHLVASHGQTVWHQGKKGTLQIGESAIIAAELGITTVSDFRYCFRMGCWNNS